VTANYSVCWPCITNSWKEKQGEAGKGRRADPKVQYKNKTLGEKGSTNRQTTEVSEQAPCCSYRGHGWSAFGTDEAQYKGSGRMRAKDGGWLDKHVDGL
jgi:hypothetical protein